MYPSTKNLAASSMTPTTNTTPTTTITSKIVKYIRDQTIAVGTPLQFRICSASPNVSEIQVEVNKFENVLFWKLLIRVPINKKTPLTNTTSRLLLDRYIQASGSPLIKDNDNRALFELLVSEAHVVDDEFFDQLADSGIPKSLVSFRDYDLQLSTEVNWDIPQLRLILEITGTSPVSVQQLFDEQHLGSLFRFLDSTTVQWTECKVWSYNSDSAIDAVDASRYCGRKITTPLRVAYTQRNEWADVYTQATVMRVRGDGSCQFRSLATTIMYRLWQVKPDTAIEAPRFVSVSSSGGGGGGMTMMVGNRRAQLVDYFFLAVVVLLKWYSQLYCYNQAAALKMIQGLDGSLLNRIVEFKNNIIGVGDQEKWASNPEVNNNDDSTYLIMQYFQPYINLQTLELVMLQKYLGVDAAPNMNAPVINGEASTFASVLGLNNSQQFVQYINESGKWSFFGDSLQLLILSHAMKTNINIWYSGYRGRMQWCVPVSKSTTTTNPQYVSLSNVSSFMVSDSYQAQQEALHVLYQPSQSGRSGHYDALYILLASQAVDETSYLDTVTKQRIYPFVETPVTTTTSTVPTTTTSSFKQQQQQQQQQSNIPQVIQKSLTNKSVDLIMFEPEESPMTFYVQQFFKK